MKIEIDIDEKYSDVEVDIKAPRLNQDIEKENDQYADSSEKR